MKFGYARVSSKDQNLDRQLAALKKAGCEEIFSEKISGKNLDRPQLQKLLSIIHIGDEVVVQDLDRLGRNNHDITSVMNQIREKDATFEVLSLPSFDGVENKNLKALLNNLIIEIYKYQAEEERAKIKERQRQGIKIAKANGRYKGQPARYSATSRDARGRYIYGQIVSKLNDGVGVTTISKELGINRTTIYRIKHTL